MSREIWTRDWEGKFAATASVRVMNPAWKRHNDLYNEGGEGYNPHAKFIYEVREKNPEQKPKAASDNRILKDERGNNVPASKLRESLAKWQAKVGSISDADAKAMFEKSIAHAKSQLGE